MTATIGMLNKHGIAVAADSAVTRYRDGLTKVTKNGNKMIRVSNVDPICVMITGSADFLRNPWEVIVKKYRSERGDTHHPTVEDCAEDFFKFIEEKDIFWDEKYSTRWVAHNLKKMIDDLQRRIGFGLFRRKENGKLEQPKKLENAILRELNKLSIEATENTNFFGSSIKDYDLDQFEKYTSEIYDDMLEETRESENGDPFFRSEFPSQLLEKYRREILDTLLKFLSSTKPSGMTELIFAGYGSAQEYPSLLPADIRQGFDRKINCHVDPSKIVRISDECPAAICPFAQDDIIRGVLGGVNKYRFGAILLREIGRIIKGNEWLKEIPDFDCESLSEKNLAKGLLRKYTNKAVRLESESFSRWVRAMKDYDVKSMATLAISLIHLTGFERILTFSTEGVGGDVDLAVITRNEGFTWLNRKSWYHHKDIGGAYGSMGV